MAGNEILERQRRVEGAVDFGIPAGLYHDSNIRLFVALTIDIDN